MSVPRANTFVGSFLKYPFPHVQDPRQNMLPSINCAIREAAVAAFSKAKKQKVQESASDQLFELIVQRGGLKARRRGLGRLMSGFDRRICWFHTFRSCRHYSHLPQPEIGSVDADDRVWYRNTCSDLLFCEIAISELSCRIGDSLSRAQSPPRKPLMPSARPTGFFCSPSAVQVMSRWCQSRTPRGRSAHHVCFRNQDCV